jgi:hypothetical protein
VCAGQQRQTASSFVHFLDSDDSDWESEPEPAEPPSSLPAAAANGEAGRSNGRGSGQSASSKAAAAAVGAADTLPAPQARLSEIYDLDFSSDEEEGREQRVPTSVPAPAVAAAGTVPNNASPTLAGALRQAHLPAEPRPQPGDCKQPQHRKRSFDQEAHEPAAAAVAAVAQHPAAAANRVATASAAAIPRVLYAPVAPGSESAKAFSNPNIQRVSESAGEQQADADVNLPEYQEVRAWLKVSQLVLMVAIRLLSSCFFNIPVG